MGTKRAAKPEKTEEPVSRLLTVSEAAHALGVSISTLNKLRVQGGGPRFVRIGSSVRYRQSDLAEYVESNVKRSTSEP
jgi:excisionase family DNA binding protein